MSASVSAKGVIVALIPFYQKCFVPTFPPDPGSHELACCSEEKREFPNLALQNAVGFRELHLRQPLIALAERLAEQLAEVDAEDVLHSQEADDGDETEMERADAEVVPKHEAGAAPTTGTSRTTSSLKKSKFLCALRARIQVLPSLLDAYDRGVIELGQLVKNIVRHICFAIGSEEEPLLSPFLDLLDGMADLLRQREDLSCPMDDAIYLDWLLNTGGSGSVGQQSISEGGRGTATGTSAVSGAQAFQFLEPNLHSIDSIDELPLPKNWTWGSNLKVWEEVKNEDPLSVMLGTQRCNVMNYDRFGFNDGQTFLRDFVESHAVQLSTPLSVVFGELQVIEERWHRWASRSSGRGQAGELQLGENDELQRLFETLDDIEEHGTGDPGETAQHPQIKAALESVPGLSAIRPSQSVVEEHDKLSGKVVVFPTESTIHELNQNRIAEIVQQSALDHERMVSGKGSVDEEEEDGGGATSEAETGKEAVEESGEALGRREEDLRSKQLTFIEYARKKQYTRQSPEFCLTLGDHGLANNLADNATVSCRWLRYPEASDLPNFEFEENLVSSIGLRTSEETHLFAGLQHRARNTESWKQIFAEYVQAHRRWRDPNSYGEHGGAQLGPAGEEVDEVDAGDQQLPYRLRGAVVAVCYGLPRCGGHGDRLHGILSLFLFAVATRRGFLIDIRHPQPLLHVLQPSFLDWRVRVEDLPLSNRVQLVDLSESQTDRTLRSLRSSPDVLLMGTNLRFHSVMVDWLREQHGYFALTKGWVSSAWNLLFKPAPAVLLPFSREASPERFLALHFRAGNETAHSFADPPRHSLDKVSEFLQCAQKVEERLAGTSILSAGTPWHLSADSEAFWQHPQVQQLVQRGKAKSFLGVMEAVASGPDGSSGTSGGTTTGLIQHVDRTKQVSREGLRAAWTEYIGLSRATVLIISNSFFGETAAEIGNVPFVYYGEHCVQVHL